MKHLDDSNKEAQEDAEMDAEIELELAQGGLCCMMGGIGAIAGATVATASGAGVGGGVSGAITAGTVGGPSSGLMAPLRDGGGGSATHEGHTHPRCRLYSPAQVSGLSNIEESNYCWTESSWIGFCMLAMSKSHSSFRKTKLQYNTICKPYTFIPFLTQIMAVEKIIINTHLLKPKVSNLWLPSR